MRGHISDRKVPAKLRIVLTKPEVYRSAVVGDIAVN
jgi:hypothetical protein